MKPRAYYIVGDVHGQFDRLVKQLKSIGLTEKDGKYSLNGKILFLGDLVDRGPNVRKVVSLVKCLHEQGVAEVILGNHEYNLLGYFHRRDKRSYLRKHTPKNRRQCRATVKSYKGRPKLFKEHLTWLKTLPLYFENEDFRAVHACWDQEWINWLKAKHPNGLQDDHFFRTSFKLGKKSFYCVERLLKGPELRLPNLNKTLDRDGNERLGIRYKWWQKNKHKPLKEVATKWNSNWVNAQFSSDQIPKNLTYGKNQKPLFIGHYNFAGHAQFHNNNFVCLDCSDKQGNRVLIYRHELGKTLSEKHLIG